MSAVDRIREHYERDQLLEVLRAERARDLVLIDFLLQAVNLLAASCHDEDDLRFVLAGLRSLTDERTEVRH